MVYKVATWCASWGPFGVAFYKSRMFYCWWIFSSNESPNALSIPTFFPLTRPLHIPLWCVCSVSVLVSLFQRFINGWKKKCSKVLSDFQITPWVLCFEIKHSQFGLHIELSSVWQMVWQKGALLCGVCPEPNSEVRPAAPRGLSVCIPPALATLLIF